MKIMIRFLVLHIFLVVVILKIEASPITSQQIPSWVLNQSPNDVREKMKRFRINSKRFVSPAPQINPELTPNTTSETLGSINTERDHDNELFETTFEVRQNNANVPNNRQKHRNQQKLNKPMTESPGNYEEDFVDVSTSVKDDTAQMKSQRRRYQNHKEKDTNENVKNIDKNQLLGRQRNIKNNRGLNMNYTDESYKTIANLSGFREEKLNSATSASPVIFSDLFNKIGLKHPKAINSFSYSQNESTKICWFERIFAQFDSNDELNHTWVEYEVVFETPSEKTDSDDISMIETNQDLIEINVLDSFTNVTQLRPFKIYWHNQNTSIWVNETRRCGKANHLDKTYREELDGSSKYLSIRLTNMIREDLISRRYSQEADRKEIVEDEVMLGAINTKSKKADNEGNADTEKKSLLKHKAQVKNINSPRSDGTNIEEFKGNENQILDSNTNSLLEFSPTEKNAEGTTDFTDSLEDDDYFQYTDSKRPQFDNQQLTPQAAKGSQVPDDNMNSDYDNNSNNGRKKLKVEENKPKDKDFEFTIKSNKNKNGHKNHKYSERLSGGNYPEDEFIGISGDKELNTKNKTPVEDDVNVDKYEEDEEPEGFDGGDEYVDENGSEELDSRSRNPKENDKRFNYHEGNEYADEIRSQYNYSDGTEDKTSKPVGMVQSPQALSQKIECPPSFTNMFIKSKFLPHMCNIQVKNKDKIAVKGSFIATKKVFEKVDGKLTEVEKPMFEIVENSEIRVFNN